MKKNNAVNHIVAVIVGTALCVVLDGPIKEKLGLSRGAELSGEAEICEVADEPEQTEEQQSYMFPEVQAGSLNVRDGVMGKILSVVNKGERFLIFGAE